LDFFADAPGNVKLTLTISYGKLANIKCESDGRPVPSFKIFLNTATLVASDKIYSIPEVNDNDVGNYTCIAWNILGNKTSNSEYLSLEGKISFSISGRVYTTTLRQIYRSVVICIRSAKRSGP
jgi:hypothetical protein